MFSWKCWRVTGINPSDAGEKAAMAVGMSSTSRLVVVKATRMSEAVRALAPIAAAVAQGKVRGSAGRVIKIGSTLL